MTPSKSGGAFPHLGTGAVQLVGHEVSTGLLRVLCVSVVMTKSPKTHH